MILFESGGKYYGDSTTDGEESKKRQASRRGAVYKQEEAFTEFEIRAGDGPDRNAFGARFVTMWM